MKAGRVELEVVPGEYAIARVPIEESEWTERLLATSAPSSPLASVTRTDREVSVVAPARSLPGSIDAERGFRAVRVKGTLDFSMVGVIRDISAALAGAGIPIFVISTFETDYILIRDRDFEAAREVLGIDQSGD